MTVTGPESRLPLMALANTHTMVRILQIKLSKNFGSYQPVKGLINKGKRVSIFNRNFIQATIIDAKS